MKLIAKISLLLLFVPVALAHPPEQILTHLKVSYAPGPKLRGVASWYGEEVAGQLMANGEPFDPYQMTAASYQLPLGTRVRVLNVRNGRAVIVTITDRGPNKRLHRTIDLSELAAIRLGFKKEGLTLVKVF